MRKKKAKTDIVRHTQTDKDSHIPSEKNFNTQTGADRSTKKQKVYADRRRPTLIDSHRPRQTQTDPDSRRQKRRRENAKPPSIAKAINIPKQKELAYSLFNLLL